MSTSEGNHDDSHAHAVAAPPEPQTPMWLPAVGALLFLTVGLLWALTTPPKELPDVSGMPAGSVAATGTTTATAAPAGTPSGAPDGTLQLRNRQGLKEMVPPGRPPGH